MQLLLALLALGTLGTKVCPVHSASLARAGLASRDADNLSKRHDYVHAYKDDDDELTSRHVYANEDDDLTKRHVYATDHDDLTKREV